MDIFHVGCLNYRSITNLTSEQMGHWIVHVSKLRCYRWVCCFFNLVTAAAKLTRRKQARRTGMAGPLGEMFDHGL